MLSAEQQVLTSLNESLAQQESDLAGPIKVLIDHVKAGIDANEKAIQRIQRKTKTDLSKGQAKVGNDIESVVGKLVSTLMNSLADSEAQLQQLAVKGNVVKVGGSIDDMLASDAEPEQKHDWGGILVLSIKEAVPHLDALLEVLREIRDRLGGMPVEYKGESPAKEAKDETEPAESADDAEPDTENIAGYA